MYEHFIVMMIGLFIEWTTHVTGPNFPFNWIICVGVLLALQDGIFILDYFRLWNKWTRPPKKIVLFVHSGSPYIALGLSYAAFNLVLQQLYGRKKNK